MPCCWRGFQFRNSTVNPQIYGGYLLFLILAWGLIQRGGLKMFLIVGYIPPEIFLLVNYFFNATHTSNRVFCKGHVNFH